METGKKRPQFGTRYLIDESDVFTHNAWDHVEWNDAQLTDAIAKVAEQKETAVDEKEAERLKQNASAQWDAFYSRHDNKFFMDRNWLLTEFPELDVTAEERAEPLRVLEVGCGVGNTTFPLLDSCPRGQMFVYSCDYSSAAIELLSRNEKFDKRVCRAFVWDICEHPTDEIPCGSLDVVLCIYVLSAIPPEKQQQAVNNLTRLLKPGGLLLLKDYGEFDLTQLRFKKNRFIKDKLYCRGDGTLALDIRIFRCMDALYYESAAVVKRALNKEKSVRSSVYSSSYKNKKRLLRLCCETIRCRAFFDGLLECAQIRDLLKNEAIGDFSLLYVLLYEFLFGKGLRNISKRLSSPLLSVAKIIHLQADKLTEAGRGVKEVASESCKTWVIPRYARVNTLKWTFEEALKALKEEEWVVKEMEDITNGSAYRKYVEDMQWNEVYVDPHIENLLIFRGDADLHGYWMVTDGYVLLQDKASCLSALLLKPKPGCEVFDVCAAPGMKTSHIAALLSGRGKIWAMDKSAERVQTLHAMLQNAGVSNASIFCGDFLRTDVYDKKFAKVRYALVDPPCSGSGIVKRLDKFIDDANTVDERRLRALSNLQAMILKHAMKLPNLRRLVYSTCSTHIEENEAVVEEKGCVRFPVLNDEHVKEDFELVHAMPAWAHRGAQQYEFGEKCLRASPAFDLTNGFFVAVFKKKKRKILE